MAAQLLRARGSSQLCKRHHLLPRGLPRMAPTLPVSASLQPQPWQQQQQQLLRWRPGLPHTQAQASSLLRPRHFSSSVAPTGLDSQQGEHQQQHNTGGAGPNSSSSSSSQRGASVLKLSGVAALAGMGSAVVIRFVWAEEGEPAALAEPYSMPGTPFSMPDDDLDAEFAGAHILVFAGGSGFNEAAYKLRDTPTHVSYVMPVSDDGGSSAEIQRVIGGPSIGDIRARLVRLAAEDTKEHRAIKRLLLYRLPSDGPDDRLARQEWASLVEGNHELWKHVSPAYKSTIRRFLVVFQDLVWNKSQRRTFDFRGGCIGNIFLTGSRVFFDSVEAAIVWFSAILRIPPSNVVIPVISTNRRVAIGCCLKDNTEILGQHNISHPPLPPGAEASSAGPEAPQPQVDHHTSLVVNKDIFLPLSSPIDRVFYINQDKQPITPKINPRALEAIKDADHVVFGMGSLYTSIIPSLILPGVAESIRAKSDACRKVLILNGKTDRETTGMGVLDMITAVARGLTRYHYPSREAFPVEEFRHYINTLLIPENRPLTDEEKEQLARMRIDVYTVPMASADADEWQYDDQKVVDFLCSLPKLPKEEKSQILDRPPPYFSDPEPYYSSPKVSSASGAGSGSATANSSAVATSTTTSNSNSNNSSNNTSNNAFCASFGTGVADLSGEASELATVVGQFSEWSAISDSSVVSVSMSASASVLAEPAAASAL